MSLKPSNSSENLMLPVSDPPKSHDADDKLFKGSAMTKRGAFAAVSYMSCAVLLVMFNKAALSSYNFPSANVITLLQMVCSCCFLYLLRCWRMISFSTGESLHISDNSTKFVSLKTLKHTLPLSGAYLFYMLVTMESVRGVNVPMYTTLRRTTVVFTMLVEFVLVGQRYTPSVILLFSCVLAFFLNYCIFLNTTLNSAVTQTICGNLKWNIIGQFLGFAGSGLYAYYKLIGK
ncbi:Nucleotide-sugar uncharacterized transporter 3 [Glycine max]|nr:Nucleotide-sugar uncharacterized transporter 3 [Glycine max]